MQTLTHMKHYQYIKMAQLHQQNHNLHLKIRTSLNKHYYVKEKFNISGKAYHELSMIHPSLPCWSTLNKHPKKYTITVPFLLYQD